MPDNDLNGQQGRFYIERTKTQHGAIVRLQEERDALRARVAQLEAALDAERVLRWREAA